MKYRLTENWLEYKKGHVFEPSKYGGLMDGKRTYAVANEITLSLLLKTGILEEVKEKDGGVLQLSFYNDEEDDMTILESVPMTKQEALEASEKIKTLLRSLKKASNRPGGGGGGGGGDGGDFKWGVIS